MKFGRAIMTLIAILLVSLWAMGLVAVSIFIVEYWID